MSESLYANALAHMAATVHQLANRVPQPKKIPFADSFVFRYVEKTVHQAIVQKLARYVTTLKSATILFNAGFVQEQAALQRVLDEIQEDISFMCYGVFAGKLTELHDRYLSAFYEEEFDVDSGRPSAQDRPMVPRKKIRAYIANAQGLALNPSQGVAVTRTVSKAYSGYVHAASPQVMDMYADNPPGFRLDGVAGTHRHDEHRDDLWNYYYRGILAFALATKAFGLNDVFESIRVFADAFAKSAGENYGVLGPEA